MAETLPPAQVETDMSIGRAIRTGGCRVPLSDAQDRISREYVRVYPPGVPALLPGQRITGDMISYFQKVSALDLDVLCGSHNWDGYISVVADGIDRCDKII